jgi:oligopeptide/dipeptide ABC transporter ATP-binding protein
MVNPLLAVERLSVALRTRSGWCAAVDDVSFELTAGQVLGIAGESGSGKTMTALALLGLLPSGARTSGRAVFGGRDLLALARRDLRSIRGREIALVFQDPTTSLHPLLRIETQLTEHVRQHLGLTKDEARRRAARLLATVRIPDPRSALAAYPHQFSGGMRQRIAIAAALACEPKLLIADEPTTALDVTVQAGILRLLDRLRREQGISVMVITHDLGVLSAVSDELCVMYAGRIVERGQTRKVLAAPRHPYTRALLDARPAVAGQAQMRPIPGAPPSLGAVPAGCAFHPRCPFVRDVCLVATPALASVDGHHMSACIRDPLPAST